MIVTSLLCRAKFVFAMVVAASLCVIATGGGPGYDLGGGSSGGSGGSETVYPPGSLWGACLNLCELDGGVNEPWLEEFEYFCGDPCVAFAMDGIDYDHTNLDLDGYLEVYGRLNCPEGPLQGCCTEAGETCAGEEVVCCAIAESAYQLAVCKCAALDTFNPGPNPCDLTGDQKVDCSDFTALLGPVVVNPECGIFEDAIIWLACCFLERLVDPNGCDSQWTPDEDGGAQIGETECEDIRECVEAAIGRSLRPDELAQVMACYGGDASACGCCKTSGPTAFGSGVDYYNCDDEFVCDRDGDGIESCEDFGWLIEDSASHCNGGQALSESEILQLACLYLTECSPSQDCEDFFYLFLDCVEIELCRSLTKAEADQLALCVPGCTPQNVCSPSGGWSAGEYFSCDRNCDDEIDCQDIVKFIEESEDNCNGGQVYGGEDRARLVCEFMTEVVAAGCADISLCDGLLECLEDSVFDGPLTPGELAILGCLPCDLCGPNEDEDQEKPREGGEKCFEEAASGAGPGQIDLNYGDGVQGATDLVVAAAGMDFVLSREYTSDPEYTSSCAVGAGWSASVGRHVDDGGVGYTGSELVIKGSAVGKVTVDVSGVGPWEMPGPTSEVVRASSTDFGEDVIDTWEIDDPGRSTTSYFDTDGHSDPQIAVRNGLIMKKSDPFGNSHYYDYAVFGVSELVPRLARVFVNGSPDDMAAGTMPDALIEFSYVSAVGPNVGKLERVNVSRFNGSEPVSVRSVDYTYFDSAIHTNVDLGSDGDLIQVVTSSRVDPSENVALPLWRQRVTQYRYHRSDGAGTGGVVSHSYTWDGADHQMKIVVDAEQFEFLAQLLAAEAGGPPTGVVDWAQAVLAMPDDELIPAGDLDGNGTDEDLCLVDFATVVTEEYESSGQQRVLTQYVISGLGCAGCGSSGAQGVQLRFEYFDRDGDPKTAESVRIREHLQASAGSAYSPTPYRSHFYEYYQPSGVGGVPYLRSFATGAGSNPASTELWVSYFEHDASTRNLIAEYTPAAVQSYVPGDASNGPGYTFAASGLVYVYEYTSDRRVARRLVSNGSPTIVAGQCVDCVLIDETLYGDGVGDTRPHLVAEVRRYRDESGSAAPDDVEVSRFTYGFHGGIGDAIAWIQTDVEAELESENGPTQPQWYSSYELPDLQGRNFASVDAVGAITVRSFDAAGHGQMTSRILNAPASMLPTSHAGLSTTPFGRNSDGGSLETEYTVDLMGRLRETVSPGLVSSYVVRQMSLHPDRPGLFYYSEVVLPHALDASAGAYDGPALVQWFTAGNQPMARSTYQIAADGYTFVTASQTGYPALFESYRLEQELSRMIVRHDVSGLVTREVTWNAVADDDGDGEFDDGPNEGVHVETTGYDGVGRVSYVVKPNATVERFEYDIMDRVTEKEVGVAFEFNNWVPDDNDMSTVSRFYYDTDDPAVAKIGNSNLTIIEDYVDATVHRDTKISFDWRDRAERTVNPLPPHDWVVHDNLDRPIAIGQFSVPPSAIDNPLDANNGQDYRGSYREMSYSQRGLGYRTAVAIAPRSSVSDFIESHLWFDEVGRTVGELQPNMPMAKTTYDGLGRTIVQYRTDRLDDASPGAPGNFEDVYDVVKHAADVDGDRVLYQSKNRFTPDDGLLDLQTRLQRAHDALTTDTGALDAGGVSPSKVISSYIGFWYDEADRNIRHVDFGTAKQSFESGGVAPVVDQTSPPTPDGLDSTKRVSATEYDVRGLVGQSIDEMGYVQKRFYDAMNREIVIVDNYDESRPVTFTWDAPSGGVIPVQRWKVEPSSFDPVAQDVNRVTSMVYDGVGNPVRQASYLLVNGQTQIQESAALYDWALSQSSSIKSNDLLSEFWYPDSKPENGQGGPPSEPLRLAMTYNRQGEMVAMTDANNTLRSYTHDGLGRVIREVVTVDGGIPFEIDSHIDALETDFDEMGRFEASRSIHDYSGLQTIENAVVFEYTDLWDVKRIKQESDGDVTPSSNIVEYLFETESIAMGNHHRVRGLIYPDGSEIEIEYGAVNSISDRINRAKRIADNPNKVEFAEYDFVGLATPVVIDYGKPDVRMDLHADGVGSTVSGRYDGLDCFGRIVRQRWVDGDFATHSTSTSVPNVPAIVDLAYTYNNASNRLSAVDARPGSLQPLSHVYEYDDLHRLKKASRGIWDPAQSSPAVSHAKGSQDWSLDQLGNWDTVRTEANGNQQFDDTTELETRSHIDLVSGKNRGNFLFDRTLSASQGGDVLDSAYDFAGNLRSQELTDSGGASTSLEYVHDAWSRLVRVDFKDDNGTTWPRAEFEYNGIDWRTVARIDSDVADSTHSLDKQRTLSYSKAWQLLHEEADNDFVLSPGVDERTSMVWGRRRLDDIVARRIDTNPAADDGFEHLRFHLTDPQCSTLAVIDGNAKITERVTYSAYGEARHHWYRDVDGDGDHDSKDQRIVQLLIGENIDDAAYRSEADLDRDGDIDASDYSIVSNSSGTGGQFGTVALAPGRLSGDAYENTFGVQGYVYNDGISLYLARTRHYSPANGRWLERDPELYTDTMNLFEFVRSSPATYVDPYGTITTRQLLFDYLATALRAGVEVPVFRAPVGPGLWFTIDFKMQARMYRCCNEALDRMEWWANGDAELEGAIRAGYKKEVVPELINKHHHGKPKRSKRKPRGRIPHPCRKGKWVTPGAGYSRAVMLCRQKATRERGAGGGIESGGAGECDTKISAEGYFFVSGFAGAVIAAEFEFEARIHLDTGLTFDFSAYLTFGWGVEIAAGGGVRAFVRAPVPFING